MKKIVIALGICTFIGVIAYAFINEGRNNSVELPLEESKETTTETTPIHKIEVITDDGDGESGKVIKEVQPSNNQQTLAVNRDGNKEYKVNGACAIKGYLNEETGVKVALLPEDALYDAVKSDVVFCTINEASNSGYLYVGDEISGDSDKYEHHNTLNPNATYNGR